MQCPNPECDGYTHRVDDTDGRQESFTMRRCFCPTCGLQFSSVEYPVDSESGKRIYMEYVQPHVLANEQARRTS